MKKITFIILLLTGFSALAQNSGEVIINWNAVSKVSYGAFEVNVPVFDSNNYDFDLSKKELLFNLKIPQNVTIDENSLQITNVIYENITLEALGVLNKNIIPSNINPKLTNIQGRNEKMVLLTLSPIIKVGNTFEKVKSFTYYFNPNASNKIESNLNISSISSSVLATGDWYRFYIQKSGVYSISKSFLEQLGINFSGVDPKKIKIYGNGGRMLPLVNNVFYPDDLAENAIQVIGEADGVFNDGDYVLFYGEGVDNWSPENESFNNLYDDKSYYYVNIQGADGKRILDMSQPTSSATTTITTFNDTQYHELDKTNIGRLGRRWFGENFDLVNEQVFDFNIPNIVTTTPINARMYFGAKAVNVTSFNVKANGVDLGNPSLPDLTAGITYTINDFSTTFAAADNVSIKLLYNNFGVPASIGYLDFISLKSLRNLKGYGKQFRFQYDLSSSMLGIASYEIATASGISQVWDITDVYNVSKTVNPSSSLFAFKSNLGILKKYIALDPSDYYAPAKDTQVRVSNQDLKGTIFNNAQGAFQDIDYLIITPSFLNAQAEKLANFHRNYSNLNVKVVNSENIYQEFGSGKQDIGAIRNFIKYVYQNASTINNRVKYVNLFGDASYDFKSRIPANINTNIVPIYHAVNGSSLGESSFASDDFFGLMDASEGDLQNIYGGLDIAVGRMIVSSNLQADQMVNKVIEYHDIKSYGNWRNNYVFVADDADRTSDLSLQVKQNNLADNLSIAKPFINIDKILLDSYIQESTAGGFRYPKAREDFFNAFAKGALVVNYLGHGGEDGLTQERVWEKIDGQSLANKYKYPLFVTLTCDFSRFDNPYRPTAGEYTYWNPSGGAISMVTTVREIGQGGAENFNDKLQEKLFPTGSDNYPSIAEALRQTKFDPSTSDGASKVVFYLGDPALMLAIPKPKVVLTKVNDMPITGPIDDLKSLAYVKLSGEILDENNLPLPTYNGDLAVQIFDKNIPRTTLNNDYNGSTMPFITLGETIFRGNASVNNGQFEFGFVVPRDIRIPLGNGRISFYGKRNQLLLDKTGVNTTIKIGGVNLTAAADTTPPKVRLYMNDETFVNGGITNESPIFLAFLDDENGINTASGIGHDIVGILDGNESSPYIMNDYFETELNNYKKGKVKFPFRSLSVGLHTIVFKAWDVYNNLVTSEIQFIVVGDQTLTLTNVLNYPNPFVNYTQFWFTHNRPFETLEVQVQVMTITGKVVWTKNQLINTDGFLSREITWDGKDDFGDKIGKGVYVYKLTVKSTFTNTKTEKYEKLVIL
jgi:hypothetical protein